MTFIEKINLIKKDWSYIFSSKAGKLIEKSDFCYQVSQPIGWLFSIYYGGMFFFIFMGIVYYL